MIQIVKAPEVSKVPKRTVVELGKLSFRKIYLAEWGVNQAILLKRGGEYFWTNFYLDSRAAEGEGYDTIEEAVDGMLDNGGYEVFMLDNKAELKDIIKHM